MNQVKVSVLLASLLFCAAGSLFIGGAPLNAMAVIQTLLNGGELDFIVNQYRLPRFILAIGVGAGLGISGALIQGVLRNPLASPDLMGISAGTGFAATLLLIYVPDASLPLLASVAVSGGIGAALIISLLAYKCNPTPARLALIGIAISAFISSGIDFLLIVNPIEINTAMVWLTGSLWGRNWSQVPLIWISLICIVPWAMYLAWRLDLMGLGEETAISVGAQPQRTRLLALVLSTLLASISVAVCGTISFVGLLSPHLARLLFGHNHKLLLPMSGVIGALLVVVADTLARGIDPPLELPAGVLTSLIGAPYFIFLLQRYQGWK
ncbi:FecCD family ABC transporter permease [Vibrio sp. SCSIO 43137]|uniref:FecCD family ABC transporter permease n=1 Tax=Vibrio sp. SCSIO 43137 TaxID=3021011 RepID=UPI0023075847|nr:iron chelate uptake ABC transporter family permease subunit [Vibrio sp. SCSIO 43137]WCE28847.1 iron chelate uptake ABC transporter family permease subunit [Vibrio sp. SCSIO 43137]